MADGEFGVATDTPATAWRPQSISIVHASMFAGILLCLAMCFFTLGGHF
ncbi:MAG: hypothetical protein QM759_18200 [Terricaulis sp.]